MINPKEPNVSDYGFIDRVITSASQAPAGVGTLQ